MKHRKYVRIGEEKDVKALTPPTRKLHEISVLSSSDYIPSEGDCHRVFNAGATIVSLLPCNTNISIAEEADEAWIAGISLCRGVESLIVGRSHRNLVAPRTISKISVFAKFSTSLSRLVFHAIEFPPPVCFLLGKGFSGFAALKEFSILGCRFHGDISELMCESLKVNRVFFGARQSTSHCAILKLRQLKKVDTRNESDRYLYLTSIFSGESEVHAHRKWLLSHIERVNGLRTTSSAFTACYGNTGGFSNLLGYAFTRAIHL